MDFSYDDEQQALQGAMRGLLSKPYGSSEGRREMTNAEPGWSETVWQQLAALGALGLPFSEEDGGFGAGPVEVAIVAAEVGKVIAPEPYVESVVFAGSLVEQLGSEEQRAKILGGIADGSVVPAVAHTEVGNRYRETPVAVRAATAGADGWSLSGSKEPVINGERADLLLVTAALADGGTGVFVVTGDATGLTRRGYRTFDGARAAQITFDNTPAVALGTAGDVGAAISLAEAKTSIAYCHEAMGAMSTALDLTVDYLKTRKQFGVPLMAFQALTFRAADLYVQLELTRSLVMWATLVLADSDDPNFKIEAARRAKLKVSKSSRHIGQEAIQLHGGIGMTAEYSVGHYTARLTAIDHILGDGDQQLHLLASSVADHPELDPFGD